MDLAADPQLRALVEASRAWGISPKRLLGWEPKQVTVHEYGLDGRLARSTTTVDVEWDDEQRELVFAFLAWEAGLCPGGKHSLDETTKPENEARYEHGPAVRCHYCTAADQASKTYADSPSPQALFIPIQLRETT
jgi:hypothetical protein